MGAFHELGIVPNYTTNGMHVTSEIIEATKLYSEGVAISCHPHLDWRKALISYIKAGVGKINLHFIISNIDSVDKFAYEFDIFSPYVEHFVLLPYSNQGRGKAKDVEFQYLCEVLEKQFSNEERSQIGFGAHFHDYLTESGYGEQFNVSMYHPEMFSAYVVMDDPITFHPSSFSTEEISIPRNVSET